VWTLRADTGRLMALSAEYICKKLGTKPAKFAGDPLLQSQPRKYGLLYNDNTALAAARDEITSGLRTGCGIELAESVGVRSERLDGTEDRNAMGSAVLRMKNAGVTTVIVGLDFYTMIGLTQFADAQAYSPEWFVTGRSLLDANGQSRLLSQKQWSHAFGISSAEIDSPEGAGDFSAQEGSRAFREIDTEAAESGVIVVNMFAQLEQVLNGIQMAGPRLTPTAFEQGMFRLGHRPPIPRWAMAGGFGPEDWSYADAVGEIWWDPAGQSATTQQPGAYRWVRDGKRYYPGDFEVEEPRVFQEGSATRTDQ
jgi:hypothetical protein